MLTQVLTCSCCGHPLQFKEETRVCCTQEGGSVLDGGIVIHDPEIAQSAPAELAVRDRQAKTYLQHGKFPTQIERIRNFTERLTLEDRLRPVLDLGCGPGPTTPILLQAGFSVVAVDFSLVSLRINEEACRAWDTEATFVQADLNSVAFAENSVGGLMMADFLQHLGTIEVQRAFLHKAFSALKPHGWFYLSFFNTNVVNRLKGDLEGTFSDYIRYRRLNVHTVRAMLPLDVKLLSVRPMNIFHRALPDRIATAFPLSRLLARMIVFTGRKAGR